MPTAPKAIPGHRYTILKILADARTNGSVLFNGAYWTKHYRIISAMYPESKVSDPDRVLRVTLNSLRRLVGKDSIWNDEILGYALNPAFDPTPWLEATEK